jgi:hypothetical protein
MRNGRKGKSRSYLLQLAGTAVLATAGLSVVAPSADAVTGITTCTYAAFEAAVAASHNNGVQFQCSGTLTVPAHTPVPVTAGQDLSITVASGDSVDIYGADASQLFSVTGGTLSISGPGMILSGGLSEGAPGASGAAGTVGTNGSAILTAAPALRAKTGAMGRRVGTVVRARQERRPREARSTSSPGLSSSRA